MHLDANKPCPFCGKPFEALLLRGQNGDTPLVKHIKISHPQYAEIAQAAKRDIAELKELAAQIDASIAKPENAEFRRSLEHGKKNLEHLRELHQERLEEYNTAIHGTL